MAYAHSPNGEDRWHGLPDHLRGTAERARVFAEQFGAGDVAAALGGWHDLGKFHPAWQSYLAASTLNPSLRGSGPEHKLAGALLATRHPVLQPFALAIAGHHGGLPDLADFKNVKLTDQVRLAAAEESLRLAREALPDLLDHVDIASAIPPAVLQAGKRACEHYVRMVFSALVDADFLDTEAHFNLDRSEARATADVTPAELFEQLLTDQRSRFGEQQGVIADARHEIFEACLRAAEAPPGVFRLAVPTGGGKTRSGMAFALRHAALHGQRRVIVAVPYVSITEQTASVYRALFPGDGVVLEHHSGFQEAHDGDDEHHEGVRWSRLAAENWDAPIIVTTTVQLLESLFAHRPSRARKLHNIAGSVIVLDEVQSLPVALLDPTLEMLHDLVKHYGVTVVLSTATPPAFDVLPVFAGVQATDIIPDPSRLYRALQRVTYETRLEARHSWDEVADWLREERQALAIVNTKADALALLDALDDPGVLHLSTLLCGAHRRDVIQQIHRRLRDGEPCVVVSTQVVEAGVDLDFPVVYRAVGPLDSIIQAAGRCNREGRLDRGRVVVFDPAEGRLPGGAYRTATDQARPFLGDPDTLDSLETIEAYFRGFLTLLDTDAKEIQGRRDAFDYPAVAERYRVIEDDSEPVVVMDYGDDAEQRRVAELIEDVSAGRGNPRRVLRELQPYVVSVRRRELPDLQARRLVEEVVPGLNLWRGEYHSVRGVTATAATALLF